MKSKFLSIALLCLSSQVFARSHSFYVPLENVSLPTDMETCFSPDEPCSQKLLKFINSATKSIDIAIYSINLETIVEALIKKSKKVKVRIVCDKLQAKGVKSKVLHLLENGVNIRYGKQKGIMHDKFTIVDNNMVQTGSFNYTNHASVANRENQIYLGNSSVVGRFADRFETIWDSSVDIHLQDLIKDIQNHPYDDQF